MMRLSTLWKVDATVDAAGSSPVAERILQAWPHEAGSLRFFRSSANFLYVFRHAGQRYFLRFADSTERNRAAIEAEIELVRWLAAAGLSVAAPIPSCNGDWVTTTETGLGTFHAVVFSELKGKQFELEEMASDRFRAWGTALGRLHAALRAYPEPKTIRRSWQDDLTLARKYIPVDSPAMITEWEQLSRALEVLPVDREKFGLIHYDFELDNLVWQDNGVGILDFDDCARYWYAADFAFALRDVLAEGAGMSHPAIRAFIDGYASQTALDGAAIGQVPLFFRVSKLVQYARMARALDLEVGGEYPEWLRGLQVKMRGRMGAYRKAVEGEER